jgi:hypothetical protein
MSKLAFTLVATRAAPMSPRVLGTELLIGDAVSAVSLRNSPLKDSTASRRERPARTMMVLLDSATLSAASSFTNSVTRRSGVELDSVRKVMRERAEARLTEWDVVGRV